MKNLLGESLTHLDNEFEKFKRGILKVQDYLLPFYPIRTFLTTTMPVSGELGKSR